MDIKNFKMRVNPQQSEIVQRILFRNRYRWNAGHGYPILLQSPYLFLEEASMGCTAITKTDKEENFTRKPLPEISFESFVKTYGKGELRLGR